MPEPEAVAQAPEDESSEAQSQGVVDRGRMDFHARRSRHRAVRVAHRPRTVPWLAVVAIAGELAADPADRLAGQQCRSGHVGQLEVEDFTPRGPDQDGDRTAGQTAVPGEAGAGDDVADAVDAGAVVDHEVEPGADQTADQGGENRLVGPVRRLAELLEAACGRSQPPTMKEAANIRPKVWQGQRADRDLRNHASDPTGAVTASVLTDGAEQGVAPAGVEPAFPG